MIQLYRGHKHTKKNNEETKDHIKVTLVRDTLREFRGSY